MDILVTIDANYMHPDEENEAAVDFMELLKKYFS
jgi:hypothetical protein